MVRIVVSWLLLWLIPNHGKCGCTSNYQPAIKVLISAGITGASLLISMTETSHELSLENGPPSCFFLQRCGSGGVTYSSLPYYPRLPQPSLVYKLLVLFFILFYYIIMGVVFHEKMGAAWSPRSKRLSGC